MLVVRHVIVAELVYVAAALLRWSRPQTVARLRDLLEADGLQVPERPALARALELYGERRRLDFADAYLAGLALEVGPPAIASFDRAFDGIEGVRRVAA